MDDVYNLQRFIDAQKNAYATAFREIKSGKKKTHWMWYIFPQIHGLGQSSMSQLYAIKSLDEAIAYYDHPVLGKRLIEISNALMTLKINNANEIFGSPDDMKLQSCMTLFAPVPNTDVIFQSVLSKYFNNIKDERTLSIIDNDKQKK